MLLPNGVISIPDSDAATEIIDCAESRPAITFAPQIEIVLIDGESGKYCSPIQVAATPHQ